MKAKRYLSLWFVFIAGQMLLFSAFCFAGLAGDIKLAWAMLAIGSWIAWRGVNEYKLEVKTFNK